jgi:hypothetical protein
MPAKSEKQRRLMAAARAYKRGEYKGEPSEEIKRIADSMTDEELTDYMTKEALEEQWSEWMLSSRVSCDMHKEAASLGSIGKFMRRLSGEPITYEGTKRFITRRPGLDDVVPEGAKKVKTSESGDVLSYIDPSSGYKHTEKAPSLLETIGITAVSSPRFLKNPKHDKWSKRGYHGIIAAGAGKGVYDANKQRTQHDEKVQNIADDLRGGGYNVLADLAEQGKSGNVASRLAGQNEYMIPKDHFLAPLNYILDNLNKSAVKEAILQTLHKMVGNKPTAGGGATGGLASKSKILFKPPVQSSGLPGRVTRNIIGKPKSGLEVGQSILEESLTPEAAEKMNETPNGRIISTVLEKAKSMPVTESQSYIYDALKKAESLWETFSKQGNQTVSGIEAKIKELL